MAELENKTQPEAQNPAPVASVPPSATPSPIPVAPQVQAPIIKKSPIKGRKMSPIALAVGCIIFFMLFVGLVLAAGYAGIKNPKALNGLMSPAQAKNLLMTVAGAFFGIIFLVSFGFLGLNGYRLSKAKNTPKLKFIVGIIVSFLMLGISMGVGAVVISKIQKIDAEIVYSKDLVISKVAVATKDTTIYEEVAKEGIVTIAPIEVYFVASKNLDPVLRTKLGVNNAISYKLSCGNSENKLPAQTVDVVLGEENGTSNIGLVFPKPCFYTKKGEYKLTLLYTYYDKARQQNKEEPLDVGTVKIGAEMQLKNDGILLKTNDDKDELLAGDSPARIIFDAKKIFTDLALPETSIIWNFDGINDDAQKENKTFFSHNFTEGKLYRIYYRLPGSAFPLYYYSFPLRALQSDIPLCTISSDRNDDGSYTFTAQWPDGGSDIENLKFEVYNLQQERSIQTSPTQNGVFTYTFPDNQPYQVNLMYNTLDKKKGFCSSAIVNESSEMYTVKTSLQWKTPEGTQFQSFAQNNTGVMKMIGSTITANQAPFDLQIRIDSIAPALPKGASVNVELNGKKMTATKANVFTERVYGSKAQTVTLFIDDNKGNTIEKTWNIVFALDNLVGTLNADKVTGNDPLNVSFDASAIVATQEGDEIIYFTWDFGDGDTKKNVTQAKVTHLYTFNTTTNQGTYSPTVTIQTKKGFTKTFSLDTPISVTRKTTQAVVSSNSHPTQIAAVGDTVELTVQADGYVTSITWDFGDGSTPTQCEGRACATTKHKYTTAGTYSARATVEFKGLPNATNTLKIKVE